jgi:hypothetical protein
MAIVGLTGYAATLSRLGFNTTIFCGEDGETSRVEEVRRGRRRANTQDGSSASELRLGKPIVIECGLVCVVAQSALADAKPGEATNFSIAKTKRPSPLNNEGHLVKRRIIFRPDR